MKDLNENHRSLAVVIYLAFPLIATNANADGPYQPTWESLATCPIPDWFQDGKFGIYTHDFYKRELLAYYYNRAAAAGEQVVVAKKGEDLPEGVGVLNFERGRAEVKRVTLLGSDQQLSWSQTDQGVVVRLPENKPCEYAFSLKLSGDFSE